MSEATAQKFVRSYQPKDESGQPIGPPQHFEADTLEELADKLAAAHENASVAVYKTKKAAKLGALLDTDADQEEPVRQFQEEALTADQRLELATAMKDPAQTQAGLKRLLKSMGVDADYLREMANERELNKAIEKASAQTDLFLAAHPEYVISEENRENLTRWLEQRKIAWTKKNLELAYESLKNDGLIVTQAPKQTSTAAPATDSVAQATVPPSEITNAATTAAAITAQPSAPPKPKLSSSGLSRDNASSSSAPTVVKAKGITLQEINRMPAAVYADALNKGLFDAQGNQTMTAAEFRKIADMSS